MKRKINLKTDHQMVREEILNFTNLAIAIFALPALITSLLRIYYTEFKIVYLFHFLIISIIWIIFLFKKRIKLKNGILTIIISLLILILLSIPSFGMEGYWGYSAIFYSFLISMFYGRKAGILSVMYSLLYISIFGCMYIIAPIIPDISFIFESDVFFTLLHRATLLISFSLMIVYTIDNYRDFFLSTLNNLISAREKAKDSNQLYKGIVENLVGGFYKTDAIGNIILTSKSALEITGFCEDEVIGQPVASFYANPDERDLFLDKIKETSKVEKYQAEFKTKDRGNIFIETNARLVINNKGEYIGVEGIFYDVSEREKDKEQIKKLSTAVTQSANTIVITDMDGNIEYTNPKFTQLTGYTAEEALGQNPRILNAGIQLEEYFEEMWSTISKGGIWKGEFCNKTKHGKLFWENVTITPIKDNDGNIINYLAIKEDITSQKETLKIIESERLLNQNLIESLPGSFFLYEFSENDAKLIRWNKYYETQLGYAREELQGMSVTDLFYPDQQVMLDEKLESLKKRNVDAELEVKHKDGHTIPYFLKATFFMHDTREYFLGVGFDITEKKIAEQNLMLKNQELLTSEEELRCMNKELVEAKDQVDERNSELEKQNKVIKNYAFYHAHEFRAPIASIKGLISLLTENELQPENAEIISYLKKCNKDLDESMRKMISMTEDKDYNNMLF